MERIDLEMNREFHKRREKREEAKNGLKNSTSAMLIQSRCLLSITRQRNGWAIKIISPGISLLVAVGVAVLIEK